jgi:hypothetical protein
MLVMARGYRQEGYGRQRGQEGAVVAEERFRRVVFGGACVISFKPTKWSAGCYIQ